MRSSGHGIVRIRTDRDLRFNLLVHTQDRLIAALRRCCQALPDRRRGKNTTHPMADFALAGFAAFFMQSPSFLAHQRHLETGHGRSNCETLFGIAKIPGDSQVRAMLDPIEPALLYPMFADIVAEPKPCGGLDGMRVLDGHLLIAWDGTEYHCSNTIHCPVVNAGRNPLFFAEAQPEGQPVLRRRGLSR